MIIKDHSIKTKKVEIHTRCPKDGTHKVSLVDSEIDRVTGGELLVFACDDCECKFTIEIEMGADNILTITEETMPDE